MFNIDLCFAVVDICSILVLNDVIAQGSLLEKCPIPSIAKDWKTDISLLLIHLILYSLLARNLVVPQRRKEGEGQMRLVECLSWI